MIKQRQHLYLFLLPVFFGFLIQSCSDRIAVKQEISKPPVQVSDSKHITITVTGDANVNLTADPVFTVEKGKTWKEIKISAQSKIESYKQAYEHSQWKLKNGNGQVLSDGYRFNEDEVVFISTKQKQPAVPSVPVPPPAVRPDSVTLTVVAADNHVTLKPETAFTVPLNSKWLQVKPQADSLILGYAENYKHGRWTVKIKSGQQRPLTDGFTFKEDMSLFVHSKSERITITVKGDNNIIIAADNTIHANEGVLWSAVKEEAQKKILGYKGRYRLSDWKIENADGEYIFDHTDFENDTAVFAVSKEIPALPDYECIEVPVSSSYIEGIDIDYTLPDSDLKWKGVFVKNRKIRLSPYKMGKYEVFYDLWKTVYDWAEENGYEFEEDAEGSCGSSGEGSGRQPVTEVSWRNCIIWCNAYTEMTYNNTHECVYRADKNRDEILKNANDSENCDKAYFDRTKKGFRLPTEAEWEFAARVQKSEKNARKYADVWLTNLDSASGSELPIGFKNVTNPLHKTWQELRDELSRVAVYNEWYDGTKTKEKDPPITATALTGSKEANGIGLFDMSGNVWEWCYDRYQTTLPAGMEDNPAGPESGDRRVWRGGSYTNSAPTSCSVGRRESDTPDHAETVLGFRLAQTK